MKLKKMKLVVFVEVKSYAAQEWEIKNGANVEHVNLRIIILKKHLLHGSQWLFRCCDYVVFWIYFSFILLMKLWNFFIRFFYTYHYFFFPFSFFTTFIDNRLFSFFLLVNYFLMIKRNHGTRDIFKQLWGAQLRIFKIGRFYIFIFNCVICLQLLLLRFPGVVRMNTFLNDAINIFCFKQLKSNFYAYIFFTFYLEIVECVRKYMDGSSQNQQNLSSY